MLDRPSEPTLEELRQYPRTWKHDGNGLRLGQQVYAVPSTQEVGYYDVYDERGTYKGHYINSWLV